MGRTACTEPQCLYKGALYGHIMDDVLIARILTVYIIRNLQDKLFGVFVSTSQLTNKATVEVVAASISIRSGNIRGNSVQKILNS